MVKRPIGVHVSYIDENGDDIEQELFDHHARLFMHELDHLQGKSMIHWKLSSGNIEIMAGYEDENFHLQTTVDFYKEKIDNVKRNFVEIFNDNRHFEKRINSDGNEWKIFKTTEKRVNR